MNLREMMDGYAEEGLTRALAASRVCQDIVLKALAEGQLMHNVTIKGGMFENSIDDVIRRLKGTFKDEQYLKRVSESRQRWMDNEIHEISNGIVEYMQKLK